jgi:hypothetical protein
MRFSNGVFCGIHGKMSGGPGLRDLPPCPLPAKEGGTLKEQTLWDAKGTRSSHLARSEQ